MGKKGVKSSEPLTPSFHTEHLRLAWLHGDTSSWFVLSTDISKFNLLKRLLDRNLKSEVNNLIGDKEDPHERDMEQEIEFSNHENNWFKSYEIFRLFYRETVLHENSAVPGNSEMKLFVGLGDWNTLTIPYIFCFFVPVKGNREGNSQFKEMEPSSFSPKNHRDWFDRKNEKTLIKTE